MLILLLEDHKPIRDMLKMALSRDRHDVLEAENLTISRDRMRTRIAGPSLSYYCLPPFVNSYGTDAVEMQRNTSGP